MIERERVRVEPSRRLSLQSLDQGRDGGEPHLAQRLCRRGRVVAQLLDPFSGRLAQVNRLAPVKQKHTGEDDGDDDAHDGPGRPMSVGPLFGLVLQRSHPSSRKGLDDAASTPYSSTILLMKTKIFLPGMCFSASLLAAEPKFRAFAIDAKVRT